MGGAASLGMALFGVFWTISAATMGDRFHRFCTHCGKELP